MNALPPIPAIAQPLSSSDLSNIVTGALKGAAATADPSKIAGAIASGAAAVATGGLTASWPRIIAILLGLLLIAAAIFSFKPVRQTVISTGKDAAKVAAIAA